MPAFTKGKWLIHENNHLIYSDINDRPVTFVAGKVDEEEKANARLIAAAPDMYRTLVKILDDTQNGQFASENELIALLNSIDEENREFN